MTTIIVLICLYVIPYVSMDINAMLDELKTLLEDKKMTFDLNDNDMYKLFRDYIKKKGEIKEHMVKQAVHELIKAGKLEKGGFEYAHHIDKAKLLENNELEELAGIVKGNANEANIEKVKKYMEDKNLGDIDSQIGFIKYHYGKKNHPDELAAYLKDLAARIKKSAAGDHSNANKPHALHNIKAIVQSKKFITLAALLGIGTVGITNKLLTADTTLNQTINNNIYTGATMHDTKDTPNHIGYSTVYILVTILIACLFITIGLSFYIVKIAYPYNTNDTSFKILL